MDIRPDNSPLRGVILVVNLLLVIGFSGGEIKENTGVKYRLDGTTVSDDTTRRLPTVADDKINIMDISAFKPVSLSGFKDLISLEIIQHEKVKIEIETGNQHLDTVTAQLHAPDWFSDELVHFDVSHHSMETRVTVHIDAVKWSPLEAFTLLHVGALILLSVLLFVCLYVTAKSMSVKKKKRKRKQFCACQESDKSRPLIKGSELCAGSDAPHTQPLVEPDDDGNRTVHDESFISRGRKQSSSDLSDSESQDRSSSPHCNCSVTEMRKGKGHPSSHESKGQGRDVEGLGFCVLPLLTLAGISILGVFVLVSVNQQLTNQIASYKDAQRPVLKFTVPQDKHIRKIRSYSTDPDLGDVTFTNEGGFSLVTRLQLLDLSKDCRGNVSTCRIHAVCNRTSVEGGFKCRCNRGYFLQGLTCTACSTSCPEGHYMSEQCAEETDVVCKPCKQCEKTEYSVAPCTTTQNTLCIDVSFPQNRLFIPSAMTEADMISLNVSMSNNVFLEELKNIKKLNQALIVANNRQVFQFLHVRPSGLQVSVGWNRVFLVPKFVDLEHEDDLDEMLRNPHFPKASHMEVNKIRQSFCRHPLPDFYDLWLEILENATTPVSEVECSSNTAGSPRCPRGYKDGETYFQPTDITRECPKFGGQRLFREGPNHFFCVDNPSILGSVFKRKVNNSRPLEFPSSDCVNYQAECQHCLSKSQCSRGSQCCKLGCYSESACSNLFSSACPPTSVECIRGDITKYGVLPRYPNIQNYSACHVKLDPPRVLYHVSYNTSIPGMQFHFKTRHHDVLFKNISHYEDGFDQVDFLTFHHQTETPLSSEAILLRTNVTVGDTTVSNYSLHELKEPWQFKNPGDFNISNPYPNRFKTNVQFKTPLLYSSKSWNDSLCNSDVSHIYPAQTVYRESGIRLKGPVINRTETGAFSYEVHKAPPRVTFYSPEDVSVMAYYREEMKDSKIIATALKGTIVWRPDIQRWLVSITGRLTSCPGCFTLELFEEVASTRLVMYDMLVNCPNDFSVNFTIERTDVFIRDIFVAVLNDSVMSHKVVLTSIQPPQFFRASGNNVVPMETSATSPWIPIIVIMAVCCSVCLGLMGLYLYIDAKETPFSIIDVPIPKPQLGEAITFLQSVEKARPELSLRTKAIIFGLVVLYIVYALLFTFCAIFGLMHLVQGSQSGSVTIMSNTSAKILRQMQAQMRGMLDYEEAESARLLRAAKERKDACSARLRQSIEDRVPDMTVEFNTMLRKVFENNGVIHSSLKEYVEGRMKVYQEQIDQFIQEYNQTIETNLHKVYTTYKLYLPKVAENPWFDFPRDIFLAQQGRYDVKGVLTEFLTWLEIDKIQEIVDVKAILMNKLLTVMPRVNFSALSSDISVHVSLNSSNVTTPVSWFRFTASQEDSKTPSKSRRDQEQTLRGPQFLRLLSKNTTTSERSEKTDKGSIIQTIQAVLYPVFVAVFLILDMCLLVYRFSWLLRSIKSFKSGVEERVPYDSMTRKIHFILTGKDIPRPENSMDSPYDYYKQNKENIWKDNTDLYFQYVNAPPNIKEEILRGLLNQRQKSKPAKPAEEDQGNCLQNFVLKFFKILYRFFISPVFWRFILICAFVLLLCLVTKAVNDLVTLDSAMFLMDTKAMLPILQRQYTITRETMAQYSVYLNTMMADYNQLLDSEIHVLNTIIVNITETQVNLLRNLATDMCNLKGGNSSCPVSPDLGFVAATVTSCNFLPIHSQPYTGFHEDSLTQFIQTELSPIVTNLRELLFFTFYFLLAFAGAMLLCQVVARIIFLYLIKTGHLRTTKIYQLPSTLDWSGAQSFRDEKDHYVSQSLIAESCESGVYDLTT